MPHRPFLDDPTAWLRAPRTGATPAEYACAVERWMPERRAGSAVVWFVIALLAVVASVHFLAR